MKKLSGNVDEIFQERCIAELWLPTRLALELFLWRMRVFHINMHMKSIETIYIERPKFMDN